jgi:hypothetical protein
MGLSAEEFSALFPKVKREALHLNMRDTYGTQTESPHIDKWRAGEPDDFAWLEPWCTLMRESVTAG